MWRRLYYIGRVAGRPCVSTLEPLPGSPEEYVGECTIGPSPHVVLPEMPMRLFPGKPGTRRWILICSDCEASQEVLVFVSREKAQRMVDILLNGGTV
jgi:hypothetical protein